MAFGALQLFINDIPYHLLSDSLSFLGIVEGGDCLLKSEGRWTNAPNHYDARITTQRILEESCQFAVSKWNMACFLGALRETTDAVAKCQQALIDVNSLILANTILIVQLLRTGQVDYE